jgi:4-hydroxybenzoate polyprenyltransferase
MKRKLDAVRRGSSAEVAAWWLVAWIIGSIAIALFPYPYVGFLSFLFLPVAAISWSRTTILSTPTREGGRRPLVLAGLAVGTLIGAMIVLAVARAILGPPTGRN